MTMFKAKSTTAFTGVKNKVAAALKAPVMPPPMKRANLSAVSKQTTYPRGILIKSTQPAVSRLPVDFGRRMVAPCSGYSRGASGSTWGIESYYNSCLVSAAGAADDCDSPLPMPPLMTDHVYESDPPSPTPISLVPFPPRTGVWDGSSLSRETSHSCCCSSCCSSSASSFVNSADGRGGYISPPPPFLSLDVSASQTSAHAPPFPQTSQSPGPSLSVSVSPSSTPTPTPTPAPRRPKLVKRSAAQKVRGPVLAIHRMRGCEYFGITNDAEEAWMADDPVIRNLNDAEAASSSPSNSSSQLGSSELTSESAVDNITKLRMEEMLGARPGGDASYQGLSNTMGVPELNELELQWLLVNMKDFVMSARAMEWYVARHLVDLSRGTDEAIEIREKEPELEF